MVAFHLTNASLDRPASPPAHLRMRHPEGGGVTLTYDDVIDSLMILVDSASETRVVDPVNRYASLLVDEQGEVEGAMVDAFLTHAVHDHPELEAIAQYMRLGSRPRGNTALLPAEPQQQGAQPDETWHEPAARAIRELFSITGGYET